MVSDAKLVSPCCIIAGQRSNIGQTVTHDFLLLGAECQWALACQALQQKLSVSRITKFLGRIGS